MTIKQITYGLNVIFLFFTDNVTISLTDLDQIVIICFPIPYQLLFQYENYRHNSVLIVLMNDMIILILNPSFEILIRVRY